MYTETKEEVSEDEKSKEEVFELLEEQPVRRDPLVPTLAVVAVTLLFLTRTLLGSDVSDDSLPQSFADPALAAKLEVIASIDWVPRPGPTYL